MDPILDPKKAVTKLEHQRALAFRHKLAMESIGLIRTCIHVQAPMFNALLELERTMRNSLAMMDPGLYDQLKHSKSFALQVKMVKVVLDCMDQLDALAEEVLVTKEKTDA